MQRSAALTLVTAGVFMLANPALPVAGDLLALVLGIELLVWARVELRQAVAGFIDIYNG